MAEKSAPIAAFAFKAPPDEDALDAMLRRAERVGIPRERVLLALGMNPYEHADDETARRDEVRGLRR